MLIEKLKREALDEMEVMLTIHKEFGGSDSEQIIRKNKCKTKNRCEDIHAKQFAELFQMKKKYESRARVRIYSE